ncbi:MAG: 3-methyl-2-oxobutanoate hydroxymethyltransferase [Verrucomicrobia bacterium]|nr:3-methyl-2-oxobutanoate hydroxymethyltransferase [Verrucomicrobiota bacterium]
MSSSGKWTTTKIRALKGKGRITSLTAYDYTMARLVDRAGLQIILVGDSLGMTMLGYDSTLPVTLEQVIHHTAAVVRGVEHALVVADMPFLSFQVSVEQAVDNAGRLLKEAGADAVKIEGGSFRVPVIRALVENGIPVMGHIGLTPQSVRAMGGYKVQGRGEKAAEELKASAVALDEAGVFTIVLEGMPSDVGAAITEAVQVPTIGIGAGPGCDGQILVIHDLLGLYDDMRPKFVKRYAELGTEITKALEAYRGEVEKGDFPGPENCY